MTDFRHHFLAVSRILARAIEDAKDSPSAWEPASVEYLNVIRGQLEKLEALRKAARN